MTALTPLLDQAEAHIQQAADALLASDTAQLEHSSSLLREAAALLSRALSGPAARAALSAQELARVRSVNERLGVVREQLARVLGPASGVEVGGRVALGEHARIVQPDGRLPGGTRIEVRRGETRVAAGACVAMLPPLRSVISDMSGTSSVTPSYCRVVVTFSSPFPTAPAAAAAPFWALATLFARYCW